MSLQSKYKSDMAYVFEASLGRFQDFSIGSVDIKLKVEQTEARKLFSYIKSRKKEKNNNQKGNSYISYQIFMGI